MMRPSEAVLVRTLNERGIKWTILSADSPALEVLDRLPNWQRFYTDKTAVIHIRNNNGDVGSSELE